jgi:hypothetical protein
LNARSRVHAVGDTGLMEAVMGRERSNTEVTASRWTENVGTKRLVFTVGLAEYVSFIDMY